MYRTWPAAFSTIAGISGYVTASYAVLERHSVVTYVPASPVDLGSKADSEGLGRSFLAYAPHVELGRKTDSLGGFSTDSEESGIDRY